MPAGSGSRAGSLSLNCKADKTSTAGPPSKSECRLWKKRVEKKKKTHGVCLLSALEKRTFRKRDSRGLTRLSRDRHSMRVAGFAFSPSAFRPFLLESVSALSQGHADSSSHAAVLSSRFSSHNGPNSLSCPSLSSLFSQSVSSSSFAKSESLSPAD